MHRYANMFLDLFYKFEACAAQVQQVLWAVANKLTPHVPHPLHPHQQEVQMILTTFSRAGNGSVPGRVFHVLDTSLACAFGSPPLRNQDSNLGLIANHLQQQ